MGVSVSFEGNPSAPVLLLAPGWVDSFQSAPRILPSFFTYPRRSIEKTYHFGRIVGNEDSLSSSMGKPSSWEVVIITFDRV